MNTLFLECNVEGSSGKLEMKKGIEFSWTMRVEILCGSGSPSLGTLSSIRCKFSGNSPAPLHLDKIFFSVIASSRAAIKSVSHSTFSILLTPLLNN